MRKKNIGDMTIMEQVNVIVSDICTNYCKYPNQFDSDDPDQMLEFERICEHCPLDKFGV